VSNFCTFVHCAVSDMLPSVFYNAVVLIDAGS